MRRLFDFKCANGHHTEKYVAIGTQFINCSACRLSAGKVLSAPSLPKGVEGPNWASDRAKKQAKQSS